MTIAPGPLMMVGMSAGELLVQRLHVDLRQQASALCLS
ncbi:ADP-ribose pyrophosphatase [Nocardiopsis baichengensis]|nr:ADP-ribose pyrophosphatase [Nocardiopsis baichengensis]